MDEQAVLRYDPFADDFGSTNDKCLEDKIVTARKESECHICGELTKKGTRIRVAKWIWDGEFHSYRWCHECCEAMAVWGENWEMLEKRYSLRKVSNA